MKKRFIFRPKCGSIFWGALIGLIFFNIPGAIIGGIIGAIIDQISSSGTSDRTTYAKRNVAVEAITNCMMLVAAADKVIKNVETDVIVNFFIQNGFDSTTLLEVRKTISDFKSYPRDIYSVTENINKYLNYNDKLAILNSLFIIALADGIITKDEVKTIRQIAHLVRIKTYDYSSIQSQYIDASSRYYEKKDHNQYYYKQRGKINPYEILSVSEEASKDEIKKAYRRLVKQHHPDKVMHLGEEFRKIAEEKMKTINEAYTMLGGRD
jgi:DnaJ like chaperone protein